MPETAPLTPKYFVEKLTQERELIVEIDRQAAHALNIAWQVLRLCYPMRQTTKVRMYNNYAPFTPFLRAEHPGLDLTGVKFGTPAMSKAAKKMAVRIEDHNVVDIYYFLDGVCEKDAMLVEVAFPQGLQRVRWDIVRARWCDLSWTTYGDGQADIPLPHYCGEAFINHWG
jgi:hypothetical protein